MTPTRIAIGTWTVSPGEPAEKDIRDPVRRRYRGCQHQGQNEIHEAATQNEAHVDDAMPNDRVRHRQWGKEGSQHEAPGNELEDFAEQVEAKHYLVTRDCGIAEGNADNGPPHPLPLRGGRRAIRADDAGN